MYKQLDFEDSDCDDEAPNDRVDETVVFPNSVKQRNILECRRGRIVKLMRMN